MSFSKKWLDGRLPFLIGYIPSELKKEIVQTHHKKFDNHYDFVSDAKLVKDATGGVAVASYVFGSAFVLFGIMAYMVLGTKDVYFCIGLLVIAAFFFSYGWFVPEKKIVFDRLNSMISYPDWFFFGPHAVPFSELEVFWTSTGGASGALGQQLVTRPPRPSWPRAISLNMHPGLFDKSWSLIVWYMDKNRPLPPGDAFDEYRERDFERRKAEGFPAPLFPSRFATPEATPEQNAERRRYWRDEDHFGTSETAWY